MADFYHYTCLNNLEGIFRSGAIHPGHVVVSPTEIKERYAVCLTTDPSPDGHGLPDGREISPEIAERLKVFYQKEGRIFSADFTEYRIGINIPDNDSNLIHHHKLHSAWSEVSLVMEVVGYHPCTPEPSVELLINGIHQLKTGTLQGKANTWWYYHGVIPSDWFVEVGVKQESGLYLVEAADKLQERLEEISRE